MNAVFLLLFLAAVFFSVLFSVLGIACMVKVFQIAEDLRYLRSRTDLKVDRPKPYKNMVNACVAISAGVTFLAMVFLMTGALKSFGF